MRLRAEVVVEIPDEVGRILLEGQALDLDERPLFSSTSFSQRVSVDGEWDYTLKADLIWKEEAPAEARAAPQPAKEGATEE